MAKTQIEYATNLDGTPGRNWNFYPGCNGPDGKPCSYCWARNRVLPRMKCPDCRTLRPHYHPERMDEPLHVRKPTRWLTCYTGDLFGPWVPDLTKGMAFSIMRRCPQHTFLALTKQSQNLAHWSPFPDNCWVGVTATDRDMAMTACWELAKIKAEVKYLSIEPLLGWKNRSPIVDAFPGWLMDTPIKWVIIGQCTPIRSETIPSLEWITDIEEACDKAGVKLFLKNNLQSLIGGNLRQEMP